MARVFPGQDFKDVYDARRIYTTNIQGDDYKVRRSANDSNLDPRTNTQYQNKIVDAFSLASRIWSNKRECWKDHFRRGHKIFRYNEYGPGYFEKDLSGYQLAMNVLINSIKTDSGQFYDPNCFCITPTDIFGEPLNVYSVLDIIQRSKIDYSYKEKKLTFDVRQPEGEQYNRFRSAVDSTAKEFMKCLLTSVGCIPRDNEGFYGFRDITLVNKLVMWPNLWFVPLTDVPPYSFGVWNHEHFTYQPIPLSDLPVQDGSMRGVIITLSPQSEYTPLCSLNNLNITLYYQYDKISGYITHTNADPFYEIYLGDELVAKAGAGGGGKSVIPLDFNNTFLETPSKRRIGWNDSIYPVVPGYQPQMYPPGKISEARLTGFSFGKGKTGECLWDRIVQYWETDDPVEIIGGTRNTQFKVNIWGYGRGPDHPHNFWPWGAMNIYGMQDDGEYHKLGLGEALYKFDGEKNTYCSLDQNDEFYGYFNTNKFATMIFTGPPITMGFAGTFLGDPQCRPAPVDEECLGPAPGTRGLIFIERHKEFERKPVSCRCPEDFCPPEFPDYGVNSCTRFPLRRCPDNPSKVLLGDECVKCIGPSNRGLVYDHLI